MDADVRPALQPTAAMVARRSVLAYCWRPGDTRKKLGLPSSELVPHQLDVGAPDVSNQSDVTTVGIVFCV